MKLSLVLILSILMLMWISHSEINTVFISPLKQLESGIPVQDVKCEEGFVLVIKLSNDHPSCIKPSSTGRLLTHGWITPEKFVSLPPMHRNNSTSIVSKNVIINGSVSIGSGINKTSISGYANITNSKTKVGNSTQTTQEIFPLDITPIATSTMPGYVKILSVSMMPNPLRVGDMPRFTVTYQNISDKKITHMDAPCPVFTYTISPSDSISQPQEVSARGCGSMGRSVSFYFIEPNQIVTDYVHSSSPGIFTVTKAGTLTVTMKLPMSVYHSFDVIETVQFNVTAAERNPSAESFSSSFGLQSWGAQSFIKGIATDSAGNVYVVDEGNDRVEKFDPRGDYLLQFGSYGNDPGQFSYPEGIAIDRSDNIYVSDINYNRIEKFSSSGSYILQFSGAGSSIAVDNSGNIYVVNVDTITKFDPNGNQLLQFGQWGRGDNGRFDGAKGIAVDKLGNIYVADMYNHRIQIFNSSGDYLYQVGLVYGSLSIPESPNGIAVDSSGNIYVVDTDVSSIEKFSSAGKYLYQFSLVPNDNQPGGAEAIAVDGSGNVYVTAIGPSRIDKFSLK